MNDGDRNDRQWAALAQLPEDAMPLLDGALFIARDEYPGLDIGRVAAQVHELAYGVLEGLQPDDSQERRLEAMNRHLFRSLGFRGNREDYYDPRNSYINDVLARRCGIPISLSVIYLEVGRLVGLPLRGVGLPGHFVVRLESEPVQLLDPFNQGAAMAQGEIRRSLSELGDAAPRERIEQMLTPVNNRAILVRMLRNLKAIYLASGDARRALRCCDRLVTLLPQRAEEYRDRGTLYLEMGVPALTRADYRRYLELAPDCDDRDEVQAQIERLEQSGPTLH